MKINKKENNKNFNGQKKKEKKDNKAKKWKKERKKIKIIFIKKCNVWSKGIFYKKFNS